MGGGEGSAAREALRHRSVEKVVMCDIDQVYIQNITFYIHVTYWITYCININVQKLYIIGMKHETQHENIIEKSNRQEKS